MITASLVLYCNDPGIVAECIRSLLSGDVFRLYVVDNSPGNDLKTLCSDGRIQYIFAGSNLGFGQAHNVAIGKAVEDGSPYHLVVNPDICFAPEALPLLRDFMDTHPEVGLVMPKILYPDGTIQKLCKLLPAPWHVFSRRFLPFWAKKLNYEYQLEFADYNQSFECPSLSGCFMFLRTDVLKKVGLFDERFFMYFEDLDLVRRIGQQSQTIYWPKAVVTHHYEKGSYTNKKLLWIHLVSAVKYFNKWGWFFDPQRKRINRQTLARITQQNVTLEPSVG